MDNEREELLKSIAESMEDMPTEDLYNLLGLSKQLQSSENPQETADRWFEKHYSRG